MILTPLILIIVIRHEIIRVKDILKFNELMKLKVDRVDNIDIDELVSRLPNTPLDVLEQFYRDHGRGYEYQKQYAEMNLSNLSWSLVELNFNEIASVSIYSRFENWVNTCSMKSNRLADNRDWNLIEHNTNTVQHWKQYSTWLRSPIMLQQSSKLHLVEGHSRYGCLTGLVKANIVPAEKKHKIWLGVNV